MKKMFTPKRLLTFLLLTFGITEVTAQISLTTSNGSYAQNFDVMGPSGTAYPAGWTGIRFGGTGTVNATLTPIVDNGSGSSGGIYNIGTTSATDRALGTLGSGSTVPAFGASFVNNTPAVINNFTLTGFSEQWRTGGNAVVENVIFEYSTDATSLSTGTWVAISSLDLVELQTTVNTAGPIDGNAAGNKVAISGTISSINLAVGSTLWIRWRDTDNTSFDGNYALDDFNMSYTNPTSSLHFRSKQTGNWNDVNTWESSSDGTTFTNATTTPDFNSNTITIRNPHTVTVTANVTIDQTTVNAQSVISINPGIVLTINDGTGTDLTVTDIAGLVLRSTPAGTASIGTSAGTISGQVVVERYNSNRRAWRLLGIPYSASAVTIRDTWMEGLSQLVLGFIPPGYGTQITTFNGDSRAANFDGQKPGSSIRIYAADNFNSDLAHTPNTTDNIASNQAYFLFVRGDRSVDRTTAGAASSATTLRTYGTPNQGNVTKGVTGTSFSLIPNPYPSQINFDAVKAIAANTSISTFYVWDATLGTVGQYRTVQVTGASPNYTYTATPGSADNNWRFIESGAAFMVPGNRTVEFTEATKSAGTPPSSMFRTAAGNETGFAINMYIVNADNTATLADGVRGIFDNAYAAAIDNDDAKKVTGFEVNLGIANKDEVLSIEKRPMVTENDVIGLKLWNAEPGNYRFEVQPANFPSSALSAYLKDNYLGTYTDVSLSAATNISFTITADAGSSASDRFSIVFKRPAVRPSGNSILVYPNPVENGIMTVRFTNLPKGIYSVKLTNTRGQVVFNNRFEHAGGSINKTFNVNRLRGAYMLEVINPDNRKQSQKIIIN